MTELSIGYQAVIIVMCKSISMTPSIAISSVFIIVMYSVITIGINCYNCDGCATPYPSSGTFNVCVVRLVVFFDNFFTIILSRLIRRRVTVEQLQSYTVVPRRSFVSTIILQVEMAAHKLSHVVNQVSATRAQTKDAVTRQAVSHHYLEEQLLASLLLLSLLLRS